MTYNILEIIGDMAGYEFILITYNKTGMSGKQ